MYLRHSTVRKDGKRHVYWRLVRSVRVGSRVRQETVATLGELDALGRAKARALAEQITGCRGGQVGLFEEDEAAEAVPVRLNRVRLERGRQFGDVWSGWTLWRALRLDALFTELIPPGREEVHWAVMAAVLVVARLLEPSSELHIAEQWYRKTARALDQVLPSPSGSENSGCRIDGSGRSRPASSTGTSSSRPGWNCTSCCTSCERVGISQEDPCRRRPGWLPPPSGRGPGSVRHVQHVDWREPSRPRARYQRPLPPGDPGRRGSVDRLPDRP